MYAVDEEMFKVQAADLRCGHAARARMEAGGWICSNEMRDNNTTLLRSSDCVAVIKHPLTTGEQK
jgi:hypothetical protein